MSVQLYLSPPAAGKTQFIIKRIHSFLHQHPLSPVWVIVPNNRQARAFRHRLAARSGVLGVRVATFEFLYQEILERAGRPAAVAPGPVLHVLVRSVVDALYSKGQLPYFQAIRTTPGFLNMLRERFAELERGLVAPDTFLEQAHAGLLEDAGVRSYGLQELGRLYQAYQQKLQELGWADLEGLGWMANEALKAQPDLLSDWELVAVDGFDDFVPVQYELLQLLAGQVPQILITLPGTSSMQRPVHSRFNLALERLKTRLHPEIHDLSADIRLAKPLAYLADGLFESQAHADDAGESIFMLEVRSPADEAREALRWLKARFQRWGDSPESCAIFVPDPGRYQAYIKEAAHEFGLPVRFTWGEPLVQAPPVSSLMDLLDLPLVDFPRRSTLDAVRCPYFDLRELGLLPQDAPVLEIASIYGQVVGGIEQWRAILSRLRSIEPEETPQVEDEEAALPRLPRGTEAGRLLNGLQALAALLTVGETRTYAGWITWLEDLLDELDFEDRCESQVLIALRETLQSMVISGSVMNLQSINYAEFIASLRGAFEGSKLMQEIDWQQPAILIARMIEARGVRFKNVAILGLSEGIFPEVERPDPFLDEATRARFGLEARIGRHQSSLFYQALTRADSTLLVTRPYLAEGGETWEPSYYWNAIQKIFPQACVRFKAEEKRLLDNAASREEALFWAAHQGLPPATDQQLVERSRWVEIARQVLSARLSEQASGPFEGYPAGLAGELDQRFGVDYTWSPSRLESYGSCPHRFFVEYVLYLESKEPPQPGFDARQLGSMLHAILENAYRDAEDPSDPDSVLAAMREIAPQEFAAAPEIYGFRPSALWEAEQDELNTWLTRTVQEMAKASQGWTPFGYELVFGLQGKPRLEIETSSGPVRLRGVIDRVDRDGQSRLRVVDYKTGGSHLSKSDLVEGVRLQLPLYALAVQDALHLGQVAEGLYWKINAAEAGSLKLGKFEYQDQTGPQGAIELARSHVERIVQGIRSAEFPPRPPRGGCPGYCAAAAWCWRYEAGYQ